MTDEGSQRVVSGVAYCATQSAQIPLSPKMKKRHHRFGFTKQKLVKLGHDSNKTEVEIMHELGYYRIWDCGHLKYEWKRS